MYAVNIFVQEFLSFYYNGELLIQIMEIVWVKSTKAHLKTL